MAHTFANLTFDRGFAAVASTAPAGLAFVAGETVVATVATLVLIAAVLLKTAKVWNTTTASVEDTSGELAPREIARAR